MQEKRLLNRASVEIELVLAGHAGPIEAKSVDISETGFQLVSSEMFRQGARFELVFTLSPSAKDIKCIANAIWSNKNPKSDTYKTGFYFSNLSQEDRLKIRAFVNEQNI